jgi:Cytochrome c7 and related cytochrome c/Class III cytochrome C family
VKRQGLFDFSRGCKIAALAGCVFSACLLAAAQTEKPPGLIQPIAFSHKLHAGAQGLKCATCHKNPDPGERMGLATAALCMQCHEEVKADSPEIQKLAAYARDKREIKWRRVYEIPSYVFFSHRAHLAAGSACATCHGEVKEIEQMYKAKEINMASCMNCHQANKASTDCTYCHDKMN